MKKIYLQYKVKEKKKLINKKFVGLARQGTAAEQKNPLYYQTMKDKEKTKGKKGKKL